MRDFEEHHNPTLGSYQPKLTMGEILVGALHTAEVSLAKKLDLGWTALKHLVEPVSEVSDVIRRSHLS